MWFHCRDDSVSPPKRESKNIITTKENYKVLDKDLTIYDQPNNTSRTPPNKEKHSRPHLKKVYLR